MKMIRPYNENNLGSAPHPVRKIYGTKMRGSRDPNINTLALTVTISGLRVHMEENPPGACQGVG